MLKTILFIDDKDRGIVFKSLDLYAKKNGLKLDLHQFNPGGVIERDLLNLETNELDIIKTIERFRERYEDIIFDAIVCDWNLNVTNINGLGLLRKICSINTTFRDTPKMMYSGTLEVELRKMFTKVVEENNESLRNKKIDEFIHNIKLLINSEFFALSGREDIAGDLIAFLKRNELLHIRLIHILKSHPHLKFSVNFGKNYAEKTFDEVRKLIEKDDTLKVELLQDLTEEAISYLEHKIAK